MNFLLFLCLSFQITPISPKLSIIGIDFFTLLPDSETEIFFNPASAFFWDKKILFSISSYHPYLSLSENLPISFQTLLNTKIDKGKYFLNIAYHYLLSREKKNKKFFFLNYHNLPFSVGYNLGEIKIGLGIGYQRFYLEKTDTLNQNFCEKGRYLPLKIGFLKGEEKRWEVITEFIPFDTNNFNGQQLNFTLRKIFGEIDKHFFTFKMDYQKKGGKRNWECIFGYCLSSYYNFYGFIFNNLFSVKTIIFFNDEKEINMRVIFPNAFIFSFGKMRFLFGLKKEIILDKENAYFVDYKYNFGLNYSYLNNFEFYFLNMPVNNHRRWFLNLEIFF
ncbi:MAG: hypothetical protein N2323_05730 [candidate division WOR-3 bacterium]|nr:hypothetical protein [candidate division WOR-3 bacterium]MCX7837433.1 hypothetical protein [candidate division WOR-3 bacterium]MDW8114131.1 hypothetical protein [candidate division WOR-3 bacterium]